MTATRINIVREWKMQDDYETITTKRQGMIIFFLSYKSNTLPPRVVPE